MSTEKQIFDSVVKKDFVSFKKSITSMLDTKAQEAFDAKRSEVVNAFFEGVDADDMIAPDDDDDESTKFKPRSKGEQDFMDAHTKNTVKLDHPVAGDNQFNGTIEPTTPHGNFEGEGEVNVQGTSALKDHNKGFGWKKSPARSADRSKNGDK